MILVPRGAAAEKPEHLISDVLNRVRRARRDGNRISRPNKPDFVANLHPSSPFEDVIDLFRCGMIVRRRLFARRQSRFREALLPNNRIAMR